MELIGAPVTVFVVSVGSVVARPAVEAIALAGWVTAVVVAAVIDHRRARLPDGVVLPGTVFTLTAAALAGRGLEALAGAALFCLPMLAVHLARPAGLGFGDVKFGLLLGAGVGLITPTLVLPAFLLAAVIHVAVCLALGIRGRLIPFGPALAAGSVLAVAAGIWQLQW